MNGTHQSYRDVFVTNNPDLFKSGYSDQLAVGQVGIFLYDPKKDQTALAAPNFLKNRAIQLIQGTPEVPTNALAAIANQSDRSKPIKGKKIISWQGRKATRGQNQIIAIGFDGVDTTKTLVAQCEESKTVFVKLSGGPIDQAFHTEGKGYVREYSIFSGCCDDCGDDCANVSAESMADDLVNQLNNDPIWSLTGKGTDGISDFRGNRFLRAKKVVPTANEATPDSTCQEYLLSVCDNGDDTALGIVQSSVFPAYSGETSAPSVVRKSRAESISTYQIIVPAGESVPPDFSNEGLTIITDCPTCPTGYTLVAAGYIYKVTRMDNGDAAALATLETDYGISSSNESASRLVYEYGQSTYVIVSATEITAAVGTDNLTFLGDGRNSCVITTPTTTAWATGDEYSRYNKTFTITLKDNVCGTSRLTELQAAYPDLVISQTAAGDCVRTYSTTILSGCVAPGCPPDAPDWTAPDAYEGISWVASTTTPGTFSVGVVIETAYVDRVTSECAFSYWRYDAEPVFVEISQHSQDYNDKPTICSTEWPVTEIQTVQLPTGVGSQVREQEEYFKGYRREFRDENPIVRELQNSILQTDPNQFYDQYTLEFEFDYHEFWFTDKFTDTYRLEVYFPEGKGKQFEAAINGYISSIGIDLDPVVL